MTASITDVAQRAGVSVATVSRALRGLPNVAASTRRKVLAAAEELDYVADFNASRLAAGRTLSIGVLLDDLSHWFMSQVAAGAQSVVAEAGYDLVVYQSRRSGDRPRLLSASNYRKRVDGLVVAIPVQSELLEGLREHDLPAVAAGVLWPGVPWVGIDDRAAAATATRHLLNLDHDRIALIGDDPASGNQQAAARREGYRQALVGAGLQPEDDLDVDGAFSIRGGAEAMARLLSAGTLPSAVIAMSDEMALGAVRTVRSAGLQIPADISVVGFDDHDLAAATDLTTVHQPVAQIGEVAAALLLEQLTSPDGDHDPDRRVTLPTKLRVRTTSGPQRRARRLQEATARKPLPYP